MKDHPASLGMMYGQLVKSLAIVGFKDWNYFYEFSSYPNFS